MSTALPPDLIYRVILDYEALHEMFRDRVEDLNTSRISIDEAGKFTPGYAAKLLSNPPMRMLSRESLGKMLDATGMVLVAVVDDARFAVVKSTLAVRKRRDKQAAARTKQSKGQITARNARKMAEMRWSMVSPEKRKKLMRKVAKARWRARRRANATKATIEMVRPATAVDAAGAEAKPASQLEQSPQNAPAKRLFRAPTPQPSGATAQNDLRSPRP